MVAPDSSSAPSFLSPCTSPPVSTAQLAQEPLPALPPPVGGLAFCVNGEAGGWQAGLYPGKAWGGGKGVTHTTWGRGAPRPVSVIQPGCFCSWGP